MRIAKTAARWTLGATALLVAGTSLAGSYTQVSAPDRRVRIINQTGYTITNFYGSNIQATDWQEDILGRGTLAPGQSVTVNFDDGTGHCRFDFKAVFSDGDEAVKRDVNVCQISTFRFTN